MPLCSTLVCKGLLKSMLHQLLGFGCRTHSTTDRLQYVMVTTKLPTRFANASGYCRHSRNETPSRLYSDIDQTKILALICAHNPCVVTAHIRFLELARKLRRYTAIKAKRTKAAKYTGYAHDTMKAFSENTHGSIDTKKYNRDNLIERCTGHSRERPGFGTALESCTNNDGIVDAGG